MKTKTMKQGKWLIKKGLVIALCVTQALPFTVMPAMADPGDTLQTPATPMELPVEVEIELAPAASLKQAPLWKELLQLLENPYAPVVRRPAFRQAGDPRGPNLPALNVWPLDYNFLTAQPLRLRTSDGEVSWDQPGPLFDPEEVVPTNEFNVPQALRTIVGELVVRTHGVDGFNNPDCPAPSGCLVVSNPGNNASIPPDGTIVAVPAVKGGVLQELAGVGTTATEAVTELEIPINEADFLRPSTDITGVPVVQRPYIGRRAAEVLGKSLFWDMQVGSDGVQACGSCHFHAGVDNRTKNQLNPGTTGGDLTFQVANPNEEVVAGDFPFHKLVNPAVPGEPLLNPGNTAGDANDVMSSMGVSRFKLFNNIPPIGTPSFGPLFNGVRPLLPDIGTVAPDPIPAMDGFRRVEPRNTPTFHGAAFNFDNFWDGRARFNFNGGSVFGPSDPTAHIFITAGGNIEPATNGHIRPDLVADNPEMAEQPVRIKFSSLASQAVGPPLSDFEMSFAGRNWAKLGKKMLQDRVVPLANQLVDPTDSVLGPFSGQRTTIGGPVDRPGRPGLNVSYPQLIQLAFKRGFWNNTTQHLNGAPAVCTGADVNGFPIPAGCDPFDGYALTIAGGAAAATNRDQFKQIEANFSMFFGLAVQMYEELTIPDDTPFDRFMDANPLAANGIGQPGEQAVLFPTLVRSLVGGGVTLVPGFGEEELFGFDIFAGANLTAALPVGSTRNPAGFGANPFTRNSRCMLCHLGPEQTDHSINISHGLLKGDAEFEFPTPPTVPDPGAPGNCTFPDCLLPAPEPPGPLAAVTGLILSEEVFEGAAQDAVEVEPRSFAMVDNPATPWDDRIVAQPSFFAFGDQGIYNVGVRPSGEDIGRGGNDPFGWPLSLSALTLKNIGGVNFDPCDGPLESCVMDNVDPLNLGATFEETGDGEFYPGTTYTLQSVNPGMERDPIEPQLPEYMVHWTHSLPAGELHPQIDEMAGMAPNTITPPNGGPAVEFPEVMFGADVHCGIYDPGTFGAGPPNFGWGPRCPNNQSGVSGNFEFPVHGTWPVPNRVLRDGAFKAPSLRNVELTGPYFHTGSYLTLRQVVDFYLRGGDFPITNTDNRDPSILDVGNQAFGFGRTAGPGLGAIDSFVNGFQLVGNIADALPDTVYRYDAMPDTDHPLTPEPATSTPETAAVAVVKFLLSLTDERVKFERAPFDRPEIFVPIDGTAPENTLGRANLVALSAPGTCPTGQCFRQLPAVGYTGNAAPVPNFLGISSVPIPGDSNDHFDRK